MNFIHHRLIQKDLRTALEYYECEGGEELADRFFDDVETTVAKVLENPKRFHFTEGKLRRAPLNTFPYHFLYEEGISVVLFLVLRNDSRHPNFGLRRLSKITNG